MRNWNREEYSDDRGMKEWNNGGSCITRSFVICIPRKVLTGWSNQNALGNHGGKTNVFRLLIENLKK